MSQAEQRTVQRIAARICANPTTSPPTDAFPHGGTALGMTQDLVWRPNLRRGLIRYEEYGAEVGDVIVSSESGVLGLLARGGDDDMLSRIFQDTTTGSVSRRTLIEYPGATRAGALGTDRSFALLVSPLDTKNHRAMYLPNAVPLLEETGELLFALRQEHVIPAIFLAVRDGSGPAYQYGFLEDITL